METSSEFRAAGAENLKRLSFNVALRAAQPLAAAAADWHSQRLSELLSNGSGESEREGLARSRWSACPKIHLAVRTAAGHDGA